MDKKQIMLTFAKWMQKNKKELANVPTEKLAEHLEQQLQTEEGVAELAPYLEAFEKEMKNSQTGVMYSNGGSFYKKELTYPTRYKSPLIYDVPGTNSQSENLTDEDDYEEYDVDDSTYLEEESPAEKLKKALDKLRQRPTPEYNYPIKDNSKNKFLV